MKETVTITITQPKGGGSRTFVQELSDQELAGFIAHHMFHLENGDSFHHNRSPAKKYSEDAEWFL